MQKLIIWQTRELWEQRVVFWTLQDLFPLLYFVGDLFRISHQKDSLLVSLRLKTSSGLSLQSWCQIPAALVLCVGLFPNFTFAPWSQPLSPIGVVGVNSRYWRAAWRSLSGDSWPYMAGLRLHASRRQLLLPLWLPTAEPSVSTVI